LPPRLRRDDIRVDWCFIPSTVLGGDVFGYHFLSQDRLAIYLIDVCGHGAAAALHSVSVVNALRRQALADVDYGDPASVLAGLNHVFPMDDHDGMFFTAWYGVFAVSQRELLYASAGHPPALLLHAGGDATVPLATRSLGVGIVPAAVYTNASVTTSPGSSLYVFSDGVYEIETREGRRWRLRDFSDLVSQKQGDAATEVARLRDAVQQAALSPGLGDDFSLMVLDLL
jgi:sigma-B regulation protein RsbU (phosphoserine phosphatase)